MRTLFKIACLLILTSIISCTSNRGLIARTGSSLQSKQLQELVNNREFTFTATWAMPMPTAAVNSVLNSGILGPGNTGNNINLIGTQNYVRFRGDTIIADLPYYGERQLGGGYGNRQSGIQWESVPENYLVNTQTRRGKKSYQIQFTIRDSETTTEQYQVRLEIYENLSSMMAITSSQRTQIRYRGNVNATPINIPDESIK